MDNKNIKNKNILIVAIVVIICVSMAYLGLRKKPVNDEKEQIVENNVDFTTSIIQEINKNNSTNYLISPYNMEIALNMLRVGADGNTKKELDKVIGNRKINNVSIKDKLNIANAIFIKDNYKNDVKKDFVNNLNNKYQAEVLYDKFETPDVINNWVKEKTNGMIEKILDNMSKDYVLGLASALALDVEWTNSFECNQTTSEEFTKLDNEKVNVEMMHKTYESSAKYIKNDKIEGIIIPYKQEDSSNIELEFVALLPSNINDYINSLTKDKINDLFTNSTLASNKYHINLSLPRFTYTYEVPNFIKVLENLGIKDAFDPVKANFKKMIEIDENVYVGEAIHKTKIELSEKGTKAAAVTYFGMFKGSAIMEKDYEEVDIKFNKPFIYMIREKNTGEIIFFGSVYEPNIWNEDTCSK